MKNIALDRFVETITSHGLWGTVAAGLTILAAGYLLAKYGIINKEVRLKMTRIVLVLCLPFLAIVGFMQNADVDIARFVGITLGLSIAFYIITAGLVSVVQRVLPFFLNANMAGKYAVRMAGDASVQFTSNVGSSVVDEDMRQAWIAKVQRKVLLGNLLTMYSQVTFFALPVVSIFFPMVATNPGDVSASLARTLVIVWGLPYQIGLYGHSRLMISEQKINTKEMKNVIKIFLNPIIICLLIGMALWATGFIPGASSYGRNFTSGNNNWFNFGTTLPTIHTVLSTVGFGLTTPLIWLVIGSQIYGSPIKSAVKDGMVWFFWAMKMIILPLVMLGIFTPIVASGQINSDIGLLLMIIIAAPSAPIVFVYAQQYNKEPQFASNVVILTVVTSMLFVPLWILIARVVYDVVSPEMNTTTSAAENMVAMANMNIANWLA